MRSSAYSGQNVPNKRLEIGRGARAVKTHSGNRLVDAGQPGEVDVRVRRHKGKVTASREVHRIHAMDEIRRMVLVEMRGKRKRGYDGRGITRFGLHATVLEGRKRGGEGSEAHPGVHVVVVVVVVRGIGHTTIEYVGEVMAIVEVFALSGVEREGRGVREGSYGIVGRQWRRLAAAIR